VFYGHLKDISYELLHEQGFRQSEILITYDIVINVNHNAKWKIEF